MFNTNKSDSANVNTIKHQVCCGFFTNGWETLCIRSSKWGSLIGTKDTSMVEGGRGGGGGERGTILKSKQIQSLLHSSQVVIMPTQAGHNLKNTEQATKLPTGMLIEIIP